MRYGRRDPGHPPGLAEARAMREAGQRLTGAAASQGRAGSIIETQALRALALAARGITPAPWAR